ncbi:uncharacterized protein LOC142319750 isoform X2 [Lycorma delicatula]|uniref:uncharacterized protein LOC142319750 isoform X2 n=1 Tax=Lycorma delicatula TaxID=130591 RepID=UPI003F50E086
MCTWRWHNFCAKFHIAGLPTIEWVQHVCTPCYLLELLESEISFNDEVSPQINLNMKTTEFEINDLHTVKTEEKMEFYPGHM